MTITTICVNDIRQQLDNIPPRHTAMDAVQRQFIYAMLDRCSQHNTRTAQIILEKAHAALTQYELFIKEEKQSIALSTNDITHTAITQLIDRLEKHNRKIHSPSLDTSLDDLLTHMDQGISRSIAPIKEKQPTKPAKKSRALTKPASAPTGVELKAARIARKNMAIDKAIKMVNDIHANQPENAGALNPQMLTSRAIMQMRDISPAYINRFLTFTDTVFWLSQD